MLIPCHSICQKSFRLRSMCVLVLLMMLCTFKDCYLSVGRLIWCWLLDGGSFEGWGWLGEQVWLGKGVWLGRVVSVGRLIWCWLLDGDMFDGWGWLGERVWLGKGVWLGGEVGLGLGLGDLVPWFGSLSGRSFALTSWFLRLGVVLWVLIMVLLEKIDLSDFDF